MTAAILQGAPATTLDIDIWIDLPARQYMRILNLARQLGAEIVANTVVVFGNSLTVNFLYHVGGLRSFAYEYKTSERIRWHGETVPVLSLERVYKSKKFVARPKDLAVLPLLVQAIKLRRRIRKK